MTPTLVLQNALLAFYAYWLSEDGLSDDQRVVCCSWADRIHRSDYGRGLHNGRLRQLARLGLLAKADASRGGSRRYYRLTDAGLHEARSNPRSPGNRRSL